MARLRSIKPEFWTSEQVMECSLNARLMFIGLWNFADDHGRQPLSAKSIKAQIFPSDDMPSEIILGMIKELSKNGLLKVYEVEEKEYLQITGWKHQRIDKPQAAKYPAPPPDHSTNTPRTLPPESSRVEGSREERNGADAPILFDQLTGRKIPPNQEADFYRRAKEVLGDKSGGALGTKLLKAKGGEIPLARAAIEQASTKQDPREYIGAVIRNRDGPELSGRAF